MRRVLVRAAVVGLVGFIGWVERWLWNTQDHQVRIGVAWSVAVLIAVAGVLADAWRLHGTVRMSVPLAVADAVLTLASVITLLVTLFGGIAAILAIVVGMPVTFLAWFVRRKTERGGWEGPAALTGLLVLAGWAGLFRPWTPQSGQWYALAAVALTVAAFVAAFGLREAWLVAARNGESLSSRSATARARHE